MNNVAAKSTEYRFFNTRSKDEYSVVCSVKGCWRRSPWASSREKAIRKCKKHGWRVRGGKAACPHCLNAERHGRREITFEKQEGDNKGQPVCR
jgi:hypothetical protein